MSDQRAIKIRVFGRFSVRRGAAETVRFETQKCAEIVAYLAMYAGREVDRSELIEAIWGSVDERGRANLRNALSSIRRSLGDPLSLISTRETASFDRAKVASDLAEIRELLQTAQFSAKVAVLEKSIRKAATLLKSPLLEDWDCEWVLSMRTFWQNQRDDALAMLGEALEADGRYEEALGVAMEALDVSPWNEVAAARAMRCAAELGNQAAAQAIFERHKKALEAAFSDQASPVLARMAESIAYGSFPRRKDVQKFDDPMEQDAILEAFEKSVETGGEEAIRFIASNPSLWMKLKDTRAALSVLEKCFAAAIRPSPERCEVAFAAASLTQLQADYRKAESFLVAALQDARRLDSSELIVRSCARLGFVHLESRDMAECRKTFAEGMAHLERIQDDLIVSLFNLNYAGFIKHEGDLERAKRIYESVAALPMTSRLDAPRGTALANLSILAGEFEDFDEAVTYGEEGLRIAIALGNPYIQAGCLTGLGLGLAGAGDVGRGRRVLADCFGLVQRRGYRRWAAVNMEKAAVLWALTGEDELSRWAFDCDEVLRDRIGHPRSIAERRLVERYRPPDGVGAKSELLKGNLLRRASSERIVQEASRRLVS